MSTQLVYQIIDAVEAGNIDRVKFFLDNYTGVTKVHYPDNPQSTVLRRAIVCRHYNMVKLLIDRGAVPAEKSFCTHPDLHAAAESGHYEIFKLIFAAATPLSGESSIDNPEHKMRTVPCSHDTESKVYTLKDNDWYPLLNYAVQGGDMRIINRVLCIPGLNIDNMNSGGQAALHVACMNGRLDIVKRLLESGALIDTQTSATREFYGVGYVMDKHVYGGTPLHCAVRNGHVHIVSYLLDKGADLEKKTPQCSCRFRTKVEVEKPRTIISSASNIHVKYVISKHIELNSLVIIPPLDQLGKLIYEDNLSEIKALSTVIKVDHKAAKMAIMLGRFSIFKYFIKGKFIDINDGADEYTWRGSFLRTACEYVRNENYYLIEYILSNGFKLECGQSALYWLTGQLGSKRSSIWCYGYYTSDPSDASMILDKPCNDLIKLLLNHGIKLTSQAFVHVCEKGDYFMVKYLIDHLKQKGQLAEIISTVSLHEFHYRRKYRDFENVIRLLIDSGMDINKQKEALFSKQMLSWVDTVTDTQESMNMATMRAFITVIASPRARFDVAKLMRAVEMYKRFDIYGGKDPSPADHIHFEKVDAWCTYLDAIRSILKAFCKCTVCDRVYVNTVHQTICDGCK